MTAPCALRRAGAVGALTSLLVVAQTTLALAVPTYRTKAIVMPGSGYLVADGTSVVTLEVILEVKKGAPPPKKAVIAAEAGEVLATKINGRDRLLFFYKMPNRRAAGRVGLAIKLEDGAGGEVEESFSLTIEDPKAPSVQLLLTPEVIHADTPETVKVAASAKGTDLEGLRIAADHGELAPSETAGDTRQLYRETTIPAKGFPPDAPSYLMFLAAASSIRGYAGATDGVSVIAPIRLSVEIPPGTELVVEGAEAPPPAVPAPADGKTVVEGVDVRYGARVRAFQRKGKAKSELSVVIPTGQVPSGLAIGIPGQTSADSGIGPSILVAIPPSPLGGKTFWPEITLEGAPILATVDVSERMKALIIKRPGEPKDLRVLLDDQPAGTISFDAGRGTSLEAKAVATERDERAAAVITVRDGNGSPSDFPEPRARLEPGGELKLRRIAVGKYRASLSPQTSGANGSEVTLVAEIPPPPVVAGDPLEYVDDRLRLTLGGPPPAVRTDEPPPPPPAGSGGSVQAPGPSKPTPSALGLGAYLIAGRSFSGLLSFGLGLGADYRPPILEGKLSIRGGLEVLRGSSSGQVGLEADSAEASATVGGLLIPVEGGYVLVAADGFELLGLVGAVLRYEAGALEVGGDSAGGGSRFGFGLRAGAEGGLRLGGGTLSLGLSIDGLLTSAKGLGPSESFDDTLTNLRADLGFRWWF